MAILKDTIIKGALRVIGKIYGTFVGNLTGNVTGNITGNVTGNCSGSSGSCTGNAVTSTKASKLSNTSAVGSTTQPVYFTSGGVPAVCTAYSSASVNYATSSGSASKVTLTETTEQDVEKPLLFKDSAGNIQYNPSIRYLIKYNNSEDIPSYLKIGGTTTADYGYISLASSYNETDKIWSYLHLVPNVSEETNISFCAEGRCVVDNSTAAQNINGTFLVKINRSTGSISRSTSTIGSSLQPVYVNTGKVDVCANVGYKLLNDTYYHPSQTASTYYKFLKIGTGFIGQIGILWNDRGVSGGSFLTLNINTMYNSNFGSCRGSYNVIATGIGSTYMKYGWSSSTSGEGYLGIMLYPTTDGCSFKDVYIMNGNNYSLVTFEYNATGGTAAALGYGNNVYSVKKVTMS